MCALPWLSAESVVFWKTPEKVSSQNFAHASTEKPQALRAHARTAGTSPQKAEDQIASSYSTCRSGRYVCQWTGYTHYVDLRDSHTITPISFEGGWVKLPCFVTDPAEIVAWTTTNVGTHDRLNDAAARKLSGPTTRPPLIAASFLLFSELCFPERR